MRPKENECVVRKFIVAFWKFLEYSQSCKMLKLGVQRCGSVSPVCRYVSTMLTDKILYKCDESSFTVVCIIVSFTLKGHFSLISMRLTAMRVAVNEVSSDLCKILTLIVVKTYLQTRRRRYRIARSSVVTCYNSAKPPETSKSVRKRLKTHSFSAGQWP